MCHVWAGASRLTHPPPWGGPSEGRGFGGTHFLGSILVPKNFGALRRNQMKTPHPAGYPLRQVRLDPPPGREAQKISADISVLKKTRKGHDGPKEASACPSSCPWNRGFPFQNKMHAQLSLEHHFVKGFPASCLLALTKMREKCG